jgi:glyoxalase family protein
MEPQDGSVGIHHVTAIAGDPRRNLAFYRDVLGLRLVKRTVNFDAPDTYHLYYGDTVGTPGTALTFFPVADADPGTPGRGQPTATAFAVPESSLEYWRERLATVDGTLDVEAFERFGERGLAFTAPDGQPIELVETDRAGVRPWTDEIPADAAIRGFHSVTLDSLQPASTHAVFLALGFEQTAEESDGRRTRTRFEAAGDHATVVDVVGDPGALHGRPGVGTVHHVAVRARDDDHQAALRDAVRDIGMQVTPQKDRQYFRSVYFREPGGVLLEIATDGPGFTRDEAEADLGTELKLPPWLADRRDSIEAGLAPLDVEATR